MASVGLGEITEVVDSTDCLGDLDLRLVLSTTAVVMVCLVTPQES